MKKFILLLTISVFLISPCAQSQTKNKELNGFLIDLASSNVKLRGKLMLFGVYKGNLSTLTYNNYLKLLKANATKSNSEVAELIQKADKHVFAVKNNSFLIAIYSKHLNAVLFDDANTAFTDSVLILNENENIPNLVQFIGNTGFKIIND